MTPIQRQIAALHQFAGDNTYISEGWASRLFKKTFEAAVALCPEIDTKMGVSMWWSCFEPTSVLVTQHSIVSERTVFSKSLPLEGALAETFLAELTDIANTKMAAEIRVERERALAKEAAERVSKMLQDASTRAGAAA